jgi:5-formyltetrahydrofolate cyclo-ligase
MNDEERNALRDTLRQARRGLTEEQQTTASVAVHQLVSQQDFFRDAEQIAFYQKMDGELDPQSLLQLAMAEGKACFLPVISSHDPDQMSFARYDQSTELIENKWGIAEPRSEDMVSPTNFDVVLVPLVGFDANCFRLGMGKGFYDRSFSFKIFNRRSRPLLVGLAHECQLTEPFPTESWDVRLDAVVTAEKIYRPDTA